jgi:thimet oligopeptidase
MTDFVEFPASDAPGPQWARWLDARIDSGIESVEQGLAQLKDGSDRDDEAVFTIWNDVDVALGNATSLASVLSEMHPDEAVRTLAEDRAQQLSSIETDRSLDRELYEVIAGTGDGGDDQRRRLRAHVLRDFRRSGVDRDDSVRARVREIADRLTVLVQDFGRAIRDDVRSIRIRPEQLDGLPDDFVAAHEPGADGLVTITTDYPDVMPFRTFARDKQARHDIHAEFLNRAWPQNDAVLTEMLDLRAELATLLGYASWPDYDVEAKMVGTGDAIIEFIDKITAASDVAAHRDYDMLLARVRRDDPAATAVPRADLVFYEEQIRREDFDVDATEVRRYFEFDRVRTGLLDATARLFGLRYEPRTDVSVWHEDVSVYDVYLTDELLGRIYLDLHPREGKFKHAAQFDLTLGVTDRQLPEGVLACNFSRGLMEHREVVTFFHEFGHLVHHILAGRQRYARFSGVATEWDFVEAPSQMLEEWAWNAEVLRTFAVNADGDAIPRELVGRMQAAEQFGKGTFVRSQIFYSALSYLLHRDRPRDLTAALREIQAAYDLFDYVDATHFHTSFGHLAGYTSGYYTYMWSKVIAKDLFSAFDPQQLFDTTVATRYRDTVLAPGGLADAADLITAFLGRPYSFDAFQRWLDQDLARADA